MMPYSVMATQGPFSFFFVMLMVQYKLSALVTVFITLTGSYYCIVNFKINYI